MSDATFRQQLLDALRTDAEVRQAVVEIVAVALMSKACRVPLAVVAERVKRETLDAVTEARARGGSFPARMGR